MGLTEWMKRFRELHARSKDGELSPGERAEYHASRDELARTVLAAQHLTVRPGQGVRSAVRVARALQADVELAAGRVRAITLDVSTGGFSALLEKPPTVGEEGKVTLRIPGGAPLSCATRAVEVRAGAGHARVGFQLVGVAPADAARLETFVFDTILSQL